MSKRRHLRESPSTERAASLREQMSRHVESGYVPGLVAAAWHKGELYPVVLGEQAIGGDLMRRDTIFRIASISKPVTAVAAMILVEEGKFGLDDPVGPFLPELANCRVLRNIDGPLEDTVPAKRPITLRDLLTLRFGLGAIMIYPPQYPIQAAMTEQELAPSEHLFAHSADEFMNPLGTLPLVAQPGEAWLYHTGLDVAGVLIARASGRALDDFMQERIFGPLDMKDTGFFVPRQKHARLATLYRPDYSTGKLTVFDKPHGLFSHPPAFESGGAGLVSTVDDYLAFLLMMLKKGEHNGVRVLASSLVEEMTKNQLHPPQRAGAHAIMFFNGHSGWGLGMAVALKRDELWLIPGRFGWDGGFGTSAYADPHSGLIGVLMTQRVMDSPAPPPTYTDFWTGAYQGITS